MLRLDKFLCDCTELTRSLAKKVIHKGRVTVNGSVTKDAGHWVKDEDEVCLDGNRLSLRGPMYIMLHKPAGFTCSTQEETHPSALDLLDVDKPDALHFAGRLDVDTTGLVLITDDGQWSHRVTSPRHGCDKRYRVELADPIGTDLIPVFAEGIVLRGEETPTLPATLELIPDTSLPDGQTRQAWLTLQEGRYHQVKRMFGAVGNRVVNLHRDQIGPVRLDPELAPGEWRYLTEDEINDLR